MVADEHDKREGPEGVGKTVLAGGVCYCDCSFSILFGRRIVHSSGHRIMMCKIYCAFGFTQVTHSVLSLSVCVFLLMGVADSQGVLCHSLRSVYLCLFLSQLVSISFSLSLAISLYVIICAFLYHAGLLTLLLAAHTGSSVLWIQCMVLSPNDCIAAPYLVSPNGVCSYKPFNTLRAASKAGLFSTPHDFLFIDGFPPKASGLEYVPRDKRRLYIVDEKYVVHHDDSQCTENGWRLFKMPAWRFAKCLRGAQLVSARH